MLSREGPFSKCWQFFPCCQASADESIFKLRCRSNHDGKEYLLSLVAVFSFSHVHFCSKVLVRSDPPCSDRLLVKMSCKCLFKPPSSLIPLNHRRLTALVFVIAIWPRYIGLVYTWPSHVAAILDGASEKVVLPST
jgi:hypothetical protein